MWASVVISLTIDALSYYSILSTEISFNFSNFYSFLAILVAGLAFRSLLADSHLKTRFFDFGLVTILAVALYLSVSNNGVFLTNYPTATLEHLYIVGISTMMIMYYLIFKEEIFDLDRPIIITLSANIIYFTSISSLFIFFADLEPVELMNLFVIKWILFILYNLVLAYVFYNVGRGKWKTA